MGIRESLNQNPAATTAITIGIIVLATGLIAYQSFFQPDPAALPSKSYYSADDGATFFVDKADRAVPFSVSGKLAVRARVFTCDGNKTRFVGYLERPKPSRGPRPEQAGTTQLAGGSGVPVPPVPDSTTPIAAAGDDPLSKGAPAAPSYPPSNPWIDIEVKKPGDPRSAWVSPHDAEAFGKVTLVLCPDGKGPLEQVLPP